MLYKVPVYETLKSVPNLYKNYCFINLKARKKDIEKEISNRLKDLYKSELIEVKKTNKKTFAIIKYEGALSEEELFPRLYNIANISFYNLPYYDPRWKMVTKDYIKDREIIRIEEKKEEPL